MIEAIGTSYAGGAVNKPEAQAHVSYKALTTGAVENVPMVSSRIRVDNLNNVAILEFVNSKTGKVIHQYPTEAQIQAFHRAAQLQADHRQTAPVSDSGSGAHNAGAGGSSADLAHANTGSATGGGYNLPAPAQPSSSTSSDTTTGGANNGGNASILV